MCFAAPPKPQAAAALPNRADDANQAAVQVAMRRVRSQNGSAATILTGGLGDTSFGQNVQRATLLGQTTG